MRLDFITRNGSPRLILLFAGWAMDAAPFANLRRSGYDIAVASDYTSLTMETSELEGYREICLIAWSLGVRAAASGVLRPLESRITLRLAVNGTLWPIDNARGIPPAMFKATRANLSDAALERFYRRVAGGQSAFGRLAESLPKRTPTEAGAELDVFLEDKVPLDRGMRWDRALISRSDLIFPPASMEVAWTDNPVEHIDGAHLPDFQHIIDRYVIDKEQTARKFEKGSTTYDSAARAQTSIARRLMTIADGAGLPHHGDDVLEIGCGSGILTRSLCQRVAPEHLELWDLVEDPARPAAPTFRQGDAEVLARSVPSESKGLVISASTFQWFNSPATMLGQCCRILRQGGSLVFSTFGSDNLNEIAAATARRLPWYSMADWRKCIPPGFEIELMSQEHIVLEFATPLEALRHLKDTGVNSLGTSSPATLRRAMTSMPRRDNGRVRLTYHPIYFHLIKK